MRLSGAEATVTAGYGNVPGVRDIWPAAIAGLQHRPPLATESAATYSNADGRHGGGRYIRVIGRRRIVKVELGAAGAPCISAPTYLECASGWG